MFSEFARLAADLQMLKTAVGNMLKVGPIEEIDAEKGYRLKLGTAPDGSPYLSPWYPHPEAGGDAKSWVPLSKGQVVGVLNPSGDPRQGTLLRSGFSDKFPQPSTDLAENKFTYGNVAVRVLEDSFQVSVGGTVLTISSGGLSATAPDYDWN